MWNDGCKILHCVHKHYIFSTWPCSDTQATHICVIIATFTCFIPQNTYTRNASIYTKPHQLTRAFHLSIKSDLDSKRGFRRDSYVKQIQMFTSIILFEQRRFSLGCPSLYYRKRGSASFIVREVRWVRERERERERDGSDVTFVALKLAMSLHFPLPKFALFVSPFTLPVSPFLQWMLNGHHCGAEIRNEFTLSVAKKIRPLCSDPLKWREPRDEWSKTQDKWSKILPCPTLFFPLKKMNQINTKNYLK